MSMFGVPCCRLVSRVTINGWAIATLFISQTSASLAKDPAPPATPAEAAKVIDLSTFQAVQPVEADGLANATLASQSYLAQGDVEKTTAELLQRLKQAEWEELDGSTTTPGYASAVLRKSGFTLSLTVTPAGSPNQVQVSLKNHSNVLLDQIPLPRELEPQYQSPVMMMLSSPWPVEETTQRVSDALAKQGWAPYGAPAGSVHFKRNAVRLMASIQSAPAQQGRVLVQISAEQLSADLPVPADAVGIHYSDTTRQVAFDHPAPLAKLFGMIRSSLEKVGYTPTTQAPLSISIRQHLIFRNEAGEMIEAACQEVDGKSRCTLQYSSAAEVESQNQAASLEAERRRQAMQPGSKKTLKLRLPEGTRVSSAMPKSIELTVPSGQASRRTLAWLATYTAEGWKLTTRAQGPEVGDFELEKGPHRLLVTYVDPGIIDGSIQINLFGDPSTTLKLE